MLVRLMNLNQKMSQPGVTLVINSFNLLIINVDKDQVKKRKTSIVY